MTAQFAIKAGNYFSGAEPRRVGAPRADVDNDRDPGPPGSQKGGTR